MPDSRAAAEELESNNEVSGAHRVAVVEAIYRFMKSHYRFDTQSIVALAALLLHATRGPAAAAAAGNEVSAHSTTHSLAVLVNRHILLLTPAYATCDRVDRHATTLPGLHAAQGALTGAALASAIAREYAAIDARLSVFDAESRFLQISRANGAFGAECFSAIIVNGNEGEGAGGGSLGRSSGGASMAHEAPSSPRLSGSSKTVPSSPSLSFSSRNRTRFHARTHGERVLVCIGHSGIAVVSNADPLAALDVCDYAHIGSWALDGEIFAWTIEQDNAGEPPRTMYVASSAAAAMQQTLERYVDERVALVTAAAYVRGEGVHGMSGMGLIYDTSSGGDSSVMPRDAAALGVLPPVVAERPAPRWPWLIEAHRDGGGGKRRVTPSSEAAGGDHRYTTTSLSLQSPLDILRAPAPLSSLAVVAGGAGGASSSSSSSSSSLLVLPPGWSEADDPTTNRHYYYRIDNPGSTTWRRPEWPPATTTTTGAKASARLSPSPRVPHLPMGWQEARDPLDNLTYYFSDDGRVQWEWPT